MQKRCIALFLAAGLLSLPVVGQAAPVAFTHVTVIDVTDGRTRPDMTVVTDGAAIVSVGRSTATQAPAGATVVNGKGKYH